MKDIEYILEFAAGLGAGMLASGAPLERADDSMKRVCYSYGLKEVSLFSLNSIIQLAAKTPEGEYADRQVAVPASDIHLEKLTSLNSLSRRVCRELPAPEGLMGMLDDASAAGDYSVGMRLLGRLIAMTSLGFMFGGTAGDIISADIVVFILFWMLKAFSRTSVNQIITNLVTMLFAGTASLFLVWIGLGQNYFIIIIICGMMRIPGIGLVNAARNLLCGNEMNGILEMIKALLEALAIVLGLVASIFLFGGNVL